MGNVLIMIVWLGCLVVGVLGLALPYPRPAAPPAAFPPVQAELLSVEVAPGIPVEPEPPPPASVSEPSRFEVPVVPEMPALPAVAEPSPAIAFALPVEGPVRIVNARQANHSAARASAASAAPAPQTLVYGRGEGRQPAPDYPGQARRDGQEGTVVIRFTVGENGRVLAAEAVSVCPWPLLNNAALRAVRERWRFRPGQVRLYEVAIRFELN
jgi:protein TonB